MQKKYLGLLLAFALAVIACSAEEWDLRGGVFIAHYVPELAYTSDPPTGGWCAAYDTYAIQSAAEQVNRIDIPSDFLPVSWYVLAAWTEDKEICGIEFGFGDYDERLFDFIEYQPCYQGGEGLEIPMQGWPGPETGTAFVQSAVCSPWTGNFIPVYYFGGYAYSAYGPGVIPIDVDPNYAHPPNYFAGFANCATPPEAFAVECMGALGVNADGDACIPEPQAPRAVCCIFYDCEVLTEEECTDLGGEWFEYLMECIPNPCDPLRACCDWIHSCTLKTQSECVVAGGEWLPEVLSCDPNPCIGEAVCCYGYQFEQCIVTSALECVLLSGRWHPELSSCTPNPCGLPYACCLEGGECQILTWGICMEAGGSWLEGEDCDPNPCGTLAVCCIEQVCEILTWEQCFVIGGTWHEEWTSCDPNPCISTRAGETSWGRIKALYR